ncbi:PH domain-containing protein [Corynebacterium ureicelerivorans]|uniref:PH domain-containing protein n=1 Tax=Corynebacterium ureicelerivorans TaxID=401472 RepID=UPI0026568DB6|nr:PH domain-containing protein [Corynebacterium ureicelerivorans]MDN8604480.1 PH domain-containing protein [Corynebacterium ureicelerivorans]
MTGTPERNPHVFRPTREHILAIVIGTGIALMGILWAPKYLAWLLIFPALWLAWVLASSTTVDDRGITAKYLLRKNVTLPWRDLSGLSFTGMSVSAVTASGAEHPLPGVTFNSLPDLAEASNGRITDVITAAREAADGKYEIIDKGGNKVLLSREEYDEYVAAHPDLPGPRPAASETTPDTKE